MARVRETITASGTVSLYISTAHMSKKPPSHAVNACWEVNSAPLNQRSQLGGVSTPTNECCRRNPERNGYNSHQNKRGSRCR